jgi:two-component system response regulator AtoC
LDVGKIVSLGVRRPVAAAVAAFDPAQGSCLNDTYAGPIGSLAALSDEPTHSSGDDIPPSHARLKWTGWEDCVGRSPAIERVIKILRQLCERISGGATPTILLNGETGTGKGLVARRIHENTARRDRPFVEINCAALPATLIEAELFGHERGAFTDAKTSRGGLFEAAGGGTLFLDEIDALPLDLQAKLLTAIEEKRVRRIGGRQPVQVDVQIVAATHEDLGARVRAGLFRADLFYRLNVVSIELPPLRERGDDAVLLAEAFIDSLSREYGMPPRRLSDDAQAWILSHPWPGNVRELRNRIERILLLEGDDVVRAEHFGPGPLAPPAVHVHPAADGLRVTLPPGGVSLEELERVVLREALLRCDGNVSRAARFLSISRQTLIYRIKKHRLAVPAESLD